MMLGSPGFVRGCGNNHHAAVTPYERCNGRALLLRKSEAFSLRWPSMNFAKSHAKPAESLPPEIRTRRLVLRRQHPNDVQLIKDAVDSSLDHLQSSVAWARFAPTPVAELAGHLAASAAAFDAGHAWAFSIFDLSTTRVFGGVALERAE